MKVRFFEYGFFGKSIRLNKKRVVRIASLLNNTLEVDGTETITIEERLLKKAVIDLSKYDNDIDVYAFAVSGSFRGRIVAIVVPYGSRFDIINDFNRYEGK